MKQQKGPRIIYFNLLAIIVLLFLSNLLVAQKKVADFNIIDSEGNTHRLYNDYLDQGKIVVLDLFFADCPPCNTIAPFLKESYDFWGSGNELVEFISLSPYDNDLVVNLFKENHQLTHPCAGTDGGGDLALQQFINGVFGPFNGYPVLIVIKPDGTLHYDIHSSYGDAAKIELLNAYIEQAIIESITDFSISVLPNPSIGESTIEIRVPGEQSFNLFLYDFLGRSIWERNYSKEQEPFLSFSTMDLGITTGSYLFVLEYRGLVLTSKIIIL